MTFRQLRPVKETLWVTQVIGDQSVEICLLSVAEGTWERITQRVLPTQSAAEAFDCWVDLVIGDDIVSEQPFVVRHFQMEWLLKDFFRLSEKTWHKVQHPPLPRF